MKELCIKILRFIANIFVIVLASLALILIWATIYIFIMLFSLAR